MVLARVKKAGLLLWAALALLPWAIPSQAKNYDIQAMSHLRSRPRAIVTYVSDEDWALADFLTMLHASWSYALTYPESVYHKLDLIVLTRDRFYQDLKDVCGELTQRPSLRGGFYPAITPGTSQCLVHLVNPPVETLEKGHRATQSMSALLDKSVASFLEDTYGYVMKTECDTFVTPTLFHFFPEQFTFGVQEYPVVEETATQLDEVAAALKLPGPVIHNLGPTWYGNVKEIIALAQASVPAMRHIITKEFELKPGSGQVWDDGDNWLPLSARLLTSFATALVAHPVLDTFSTTTAFDAHTGSDGLVEGFYNLHARREDTHFSKFEMYRDAYASVDLLHQDISSARGYCVYVALSSWRLLPARLKTPLKDLPSSDFYDLLPAGIDDTYDSYADIFYDARDIDLSSIRSVTHEGAKSVRGNVGRRDAWGTSSGAGLVRSGEKERTYLGVVWGSDGGTEEKSLMVTLLQKSDRGDVGYVGPVRPIINNEAAFSNNGVYEDDASTFGVPRKGREGVVGPHTPEPDPQGTAEWETEPVGAHPGPNNPSLNPNLFHWAAAKLHSILRLVLPGSSDAGWGIEAVEAQQPGPSHRDTPLRRAGRAAAKLYSALKSGLTASLADQETTTAESAAGSGVGTLSNSVGSGAGSVGPLIVRDGRVHFVVEPRGNGRDNGGYDDGEGNGQGNGQPRNDAYDDGYYTTISSGSGSGDEGAEAVTVKCEPQGTGKELRLKSMGSGDRVGRKMIRQGVV